MSFDMKTKPKHLILITNVYAFCDINFKWKWARTISTRLTSSQNAKWLTVTNYNYNILSRMICEICRFFVSWTWKKEKLLLLDQKANFFFLVRCCCCCCWCVTTILTWKPMIYKNPKIKTTDRLKILTENNN